MNDLEIAQEFRAAASYLRKYGWRQKEFGSPGCARCLVGGLLGFRPTLALFSDEVLGARLDHFALVLRMEQHSSSRMLWEGMSVWSEWPGRTAEEVIDRLESTALALEVRALATQQSAIVESSDSGENLLSPIAVDELVVRALAANQPFVDTANVAIEATDLIAVSREGVAV